MFLLVVLLIALVVTFAIRGSVEGLARVRIKHSWLFVAGLGIQIAVFNSSPVGETLKPYSGFFHVASYLLIGGGFMFNLRLHGWPVIGIGALLNLMVITVNKGFMPASLAAVKWAGIVDSYYRDGGRMVFNNSIIAGPGTVMWWLGDIFAIPRYFPLHNVFSVGDILIGLGIVSFVWNSCERNNRKIEGTPT